MSHTDPRILFTTGPEGAPVVKVELTNRPGLFATLDREDFDNLISWGFPRRWFLNPSGTGHAYVRFAPGRFKGSNETVARTLMQPGKGVIVTYRNGDRLDLRRANLLLRHGRAAGQTWREEGEAA